jgi:hypothetical protein
MRRSENEKSGLMLIQEKVRQGKVPIAQESYLWDRIAMHEGRPQRYGTQSLPCADGQYRRWKTEDPEHLNERRAAIGMPPVDADPPETEPTPQAFDEYLKWRSGYEDWLRKAGWRQS